MILSQAFPGLISITNPTGLMSRSFAIFYFVLIFTDPKWIISYRPTVTDLTIVYGHRHVIVVSAGRPLSRICCFTLSSFHDDRCD